MNKKIISLVTSLAVFSLAMIFSIQTTHQAQAQTVNCPAGYTCTPVAPQFSGCPVGYTCTPVTVTSNPPPVSNPVSTNSQGCYTWSDHLGLGEKNASVVALQTFLIAKGYDIPLISHGGIAKGYFGQSTASALAKYQSSVGISPTGMFGATTRSNINSNLCGSNNNPQSPTNPVQSSISVLSPTQGGTYSVGTPIPITWGGMWSGNDTFNIQWGTAMSNGGEKGGSIVTTLTQAQAGCTGYGKGVCGYSWTPTYQTGPIQITIFRNGTSDQGMSGSFSVVATSTIGQLNITSISPTSGGLNTSVTINGSGFSSGNTVEFDQNGKAMGGLNGPSLQSVTPNQITFTLSSLFTSNIQPGTYQVKVTNNYSMTNSGSNSVNFTINSGTVTAQPSLTSISGTLIPGSNVTVNGQNLTNISSVYLVPVNPGQTQYLEWSAQQGNSLGIPVPNISSGQYYLYVVTSSGTSNSITVTVGSSTLTTPQPPVISGGTFPTTLNVGQVGTWSVNASDPQNNSLTYSVNWGDNGTACPVGYVCSNSAVTPFVQTSTFTHSYALAGNYTITFAVNDSAGLSAHTSTTVQVGNTSTQQSSATISLDPASPITSTVTVTNASAGTYLGLPILVFDVNAKGDNLHLHSITVNLNTGMANNTGSVGNVTTAYLYQGSTLITSTAVSNNLAVFGNISDNTAGTSIPVNTTVPFTVKVDVSGLGSTGSSIGVTGVLSASSIGSNVLIYNSANSLATVTGGAGGYTQSVEGVGAVVTPPITPTAALCTPITINGTTYSLSPCTITATMVHGQGNKNFSATIVGSGLYGFSTRGYGVGFPTYGIIANTASGGAQGSFPLGLYFNDSYLTANGDQPKTYTGYLPVHIFQGSETGNDNNFLNLGITLTVYPASSTSAVGLNSSGSSLSASIWNAVGQYFNSQQ